MIRFFAVSIGLLLLSLPLAPPRASARQLVANPTVNPGSPNHYLTLLGQLSPGDTLHLPAGTYADRLSVRDLEGRADAWITIRGPASGPPAVITTTSLCCNVVQLGNTAYVALENLTVESGGLDGIDGINAGGSWTHDIRIENCTLVGQDSHQQTVGISTKSPAWNWVIRRNQIIQAGTGMYLGNSDGSQPFIGGLVEGNLIQNTIGYNIQIKHQNPYGGQSWTSLLPAGPHRTTLRNNVFIKAKDDWPAERIDGARPNLLVGTFPDTGPGSSDLYEIYANFFYKNPDEALLQATGRVVVHDNIFVEPALGYYAAYFTDHNGPLKLAHVFQNTIYSISGWGIGFANAAREGDSVVGNLVFADDRPLNGPIASQGFNELAAVSDAPNYVASPSATLGSMDFYPLGSCARCEGAAIDTSAFTGYDDYDFNGIPKTSFTYRGAYSGRGTNPGWRLDGSRKVGGPSSDLGAADTTPPAPPEDLLAR